MEEMVEMHGLKDWECLEELLRWYLRMNGKNNHEFIVGAFVDLLAGINGGHSFTSVASAFSSSTHLSHQEKMVYFALFLSFVGALVGAHFHTAYGSGGLNTAMRVCLGFSWLMVIDKRSIGVRIFCMISIAVSFGAMIGPFLSLFFQTDPQSIKDFFMASMLLFLSHMLSIRRGQRDAVHEITMLTAPLVTILWAATPKFIPELYMHVAYLLSVLAMWRIFAAIGRWRVPVLGISIRLHLEFISIISFCFEYSIVQLMVIYLLILFFLVHLRMHTIQSIKVAAQIDGNDFIVTASISFFTEFVGRSVYLAIDLGSKVAGRVYEYLEELLAFE